MEKCEFALKNLNIKFILISRFIKSFLSTNQKTKRKEIKNETSIDFHAD